MIAVTAANAPAMAMVHAAAFRCTEAWNATAMADLLAMPGAFGFLDPAGGLVLARVVAGEAEVLTLAVAPEQRRRGIARRLLTHAMSTVPPMPWFLEVAADNAPACALYRDAGFTPCGFRRAYYPSGADAVVLRWAPA